MKTIGKYSEYEDLAVKFCTCQTHYIVPQKNKSWPAQQTSTLRDCLFHRYSLDVSITAVTSATQ